MQLEQRCDADDGRLAHALVAHFLLHGLAAQLVQLVQGGHDVHHLLRLTADLGDAGEQLTVVELHHHGKAERGEDVVEELHQLHFVQQAGAADHVGIALEELAVAPLLRPVGAPHGLHLVALEGEGERVLVLHDEAGEGDREVVAEGLLAELGAQFPGMHLLPCGQGLFHLGGHLVPGVTAVQHLEDQPVALLAVLAGEGLELLHGGRLDGQVAVAFEHAPDGVQDVLAAAHLHRGEVARALGDGRLLGHWRRKYGGRSSTPQKQRTAQAKPKGGPPTRTVRT